MSKNVSLSLLLPPSEGKAASGDPGQPWAPASGQFGAHLGVRRAQVAAALAELGGGTEKLLGVGGAHLARAQEANEHLVGAPSLPAAQRYTGGPVLPSPWCRACWAWWGSTTPPPTTA